MENELRPPTEHEMQGPSNTGEKRKVRLRSYMDELAKKIEASKVNKQRNDIG